MPHAMVDARLEHLHLPLHPNQQIASNAHFKRTLRDGTGGSINEIDCFLKCFQA